MNDGGTLRPEHRRAWARCYVRFIESYEAEGVPIWGVSVQNEPMARPRWDSCLYTAEEERDFVRDHLGPALHDAGLGHVKIVIWDHNRDLMVERASVVSEPQRVGEHRLPAFGASVAPLSVNRPSGAAHGDCRSAWP